MDVGDINRERQPSLVVLKAKVAAVHSDPRGALHGAARLPPRAWQAWGTSEPAFPRPPDLLNKDVCDIVAKTVLRARLRPGVTARTLRHSFATHLMDRGVDLSIIASLMGHRSPQETGVYLHVLPQRPEAAVRTLTIGEPS